VEPSHGQNVGVLEGLLCNWLKALQSGLPALCCVTFTLLYVLRVRKQGITVIEMDVKHTNVTNRTFAFYGDAS
jgi:hypothetical protein